MTPATRTESRGLVVLAAVATAAAGAVHLAAAVPHFADADLLGFGFVGMGLAQVVVAILLALRRPHRVAVGTAIALNLLALTVWAVSRSIGLPIGHAGPEQIGLPGLVTVAFEVVSVGILAWSTRTDRTRRARPLALGVFLAAALVAAGGTTSAIAGLANGHGHDGETNHGGETHEAGHADDAGHHDSEEDGRAAATGGHDTADGHHDDEPADDQDTADGHHDDEEAISSGRVLHEHADGSLHLHATGTVHEHPDGTVHLHDAAPVAEPRGGDPGEPASDASAVPTTSPDRETDTASEPDPEADHTHAPGDEH